MDIVKVLYKTNTVKGNSPLKGNLKAIKRNK